jgi:ferredoxin
MVKDEDLCVHCGLCAERCPTAAWDMQKFTLLRPHAVDEAAPTRQAQVRHLRHATSTHSSTAVRYSDASTQGQAQ